MFVCTCVESILSLVTHLTKEHRNEAQIAEGYIILIECHNHKSKDQLTVFLFYSESLL